MTKRNKNGDELPLAAMRIQVLDGERPVRGRGYRTEEPEFSNPEEIAEAYAKAKESEHWPVRFIDHVDNLRPGQKIDRDRMGKIYDQLKEFAKMTGVPILVSSQSPSVAGAKTHADIEGRPTLFTHHRDKTRWQQEFMCYPSHRHFESLKTVDLYDELGAHMGEIRLEECGRWTVLEKWDDIRIGKEFWFIAGQFDGDPIVARGRVDEYVFKHLRGRLKPRTFLCMRLPNGHVTACYDTDLYETEEAAEKARLQQLQEEQDDNQGTGGDE
jgi:hypothetical protein